MAFEQLFTSRHYNFRMSVAWGWKGGRWGGVESELAHSIASTLLCFTVVAWTCSGYGYTVLMAFSRYAIIIGSLPCWILGEFYSHGCDVRSDAYKGMSG